ncbi:acyl carrier protein [Spongiactinospora gelatinilytica]|uniref:Acyl carrier protein n=2 Tax=Spongiactinospora TaxID=2871671 RepID=A0A2W2GZ71_9ACTN|nr:phosphopantetheine-binding protein [Spongiactinospora gelatinilytica]PZG53362.1 acyl carrier protein [Spongiactinospora gelatinilytica]
MQKFTLDDLKRVVGKCLGASEAAELTEESADTPFEKLGLDSLARYEVVTVIQEELRLPIPDDDVDQMATARMVLDYVNGRLAGVAP